MIGLAAVRGIQICRGKGEQQVSLGENHNSGENSPRTFDKSRRYLGLGTHFGKGAPDNESKEAGVTAVAPTKPHLTLTEYNLGGGLCYE